MIARVALALAVTAVVTLALSLVAYDRAREAWTPASAAIGTSAYDAGASDAAYASVDAALAWVRHAARIAAACIVIAGVTIGRASERRERAVRAGWPRIAARAVDIAALLLALAASRVSTSNPAATLAFDWTLPALALAVVLGCVTSGATLGDRLLANR